MRVRVIHEHVSLANDSDTHAHAVALLQKRPAMYRTLAK